VETKVTTSTFNGAADCDDNGGIILAAKNFFHDLEYGKGPEAVAKYTTSGATFSCMCLPQKTIAEYADFMKAISTVVAPDATYDVLSLTSNANAVTIVAEMKATHTGQVEGLCPPPANPPKKTTCHYVYTMSFDCSGKITGMHKVFDIFTAFTKFGWPLPPTA